MRQPGGAPFAKHFDGQRFFNPDARQARGFRDLLRWKFQYPAEPCPKFVADVEPSKPPARVTGDELRVTFVNHSTVLIQFEGANILTDPIWPERASPFTWAGPRRRRAPGVRCEDLPPIHLVLISHNHYDHLDLRTLAWLMERGQSQFVVPLGVARLLRAHGIGPAHELDWGQSLALPPVTMHSVPAMHFSGRSPFDRNRTLWCGFVIEVHNGLAYFAGDTGFGAHFAQIRERFGAPRLALLPIGAYEPRWFMAPIHMSPGDAIEAHRILGARTSIAIHHGTFQLGNDCIDTPRRDLAANRPGDSFLALNNGEWAEV